MTFSLSALSAKQGSLRLRARLIQAIRKFFIDHNYLEVETPTLISAPLPETYIDCPACDNHYLHSSPESCMKQMLAARYDRIFQICKCFRSGESGNKHLPEFTMLEWYQKGNNYQAAMDETEALVMFIALSLNMLHSISLNGCTVNLSAPWKRITVKEAFSQYAPLSMSAALTEGRFDELLAIHIEPHLGISKPIFLYDYPASADALAQPKRDDASLVERFELYIGGLELANGFSELLDREAHLRRFAKVQQQRRKMGKANSPLPEDFLQALPMLPACAGVAAGIDRLAMVFAGSANIGDVVAFLPGE